MSKTSIINARIFDGSRIIPQTTVTIEGNLISALGQGPADKDTTVVDAKNGFLLPGLIDSHIHLHGPENLKQLAQNGVTTGLDMASFSPALISALHTLADAGGLTDIRTPGVPACAPGSRHSHIPGFPASGLVANSDEAAKFVKARIDEGVDYIKLIADEPGFDQLTLNALVVSFDFPIYLGSLTMNSGRSHKTWQDDYRTRYTKLRISTGPECENKSSYSCPD